MSDMTTFITYDGVCYAAHQALSSTDMAVPPQPNDTYAFNRESYAWEEDRDKLLAVKLKAINGVFDKGDKDFFIRTRTGLNVNGGAQALRDLEDLLFYMRKKQVNSTLFRDYENNMHELTLPQIQDIYLDIIAYKQDLYTKKWQTELKD